MALIEMKMTIQQAAIIRDALGCYRAVMAWNARALHATEDEQRNAEVRKHAIDELLGDLA